MFFRDFYIILIGLKRLGPKIFFPNPLFAEGKKISWELVIKKFAM